MTVALVFRLRKDQKGKSRIESELFFQTAVDVEQIKLTTLWQENKKLLTGEFTVIYRFKDFSPEDLNK